MLSISEIWGCIVSPLHPQAPPALKNFPAYARLFFALLLHPSLDPLSSYCNKVKLFLKKYSHFPLCQFFCRPLFGLLFALITVHTTNMILLIFQLFTPKDYNWSSILIKRKVFENKNTYFRKDFGKLRHRYYLYRYWIVTLHARKFEHDFGQHR